MYVIDNENQKSKFERPRIKRKIIEETNVSEEIAEKISLSVAKTIKDNYKEEISTNTIRSLINAQLIKRGLLEEEEKSRKLGMSVSDYEKLLSEGCKDNANIGFSPEMVSKYAYDSIAKEYALLTMPEDCANAHIEGYFHCLSENNNIIVKDSKDNILKVNIKKFVEKMFGKEDYYVPSINTNHLKKSWKKVKYATKTGYKKCYEITFSNGYKVEVTKDHKLIKYDNKKIIPKNYDITLKDYINTGDNFIINLNYKTKEYEKLKILSYKYIGKKEVYNLTVEINHNFLAGTEGYILVQNCHDLEYYNTRPNCISGNNNIIIKDEDDNISYTTIKHFVEEMFLTDENYYVPSLNIKTNTMEWKKIENAYLSSPLEETYLVTFGKGYSIECTSDHKFIKSHNNKPQKQYDIKVSEFDNYKDLRLCNITDLKENNNLNDYNESALFGFFLGDGYISHKGNISFNFSKKDKAEYLYHLLEQLNIKFTYSEKESNYYDSGYLYSFYIKDKIYPQLSKSELIKKYTSKYNLTGILEGLINSDGHIRLDINNVLRLNFTNTNKNIFDLYQLCLISNGIRGSINITEFDNPNHKDAYNSSSFGEKLLSLLSSMNICNRFIPIIKEANPNMKKYNENSELIVRSIEYTGTQAVYNLTIADNHNYLAGINGFVLIQNCMNYTSEFFAKNGLKIDGIGLMGSVAKPAKSLEVLLNHMLQALMAGATVFSGGQGFANFNTFLAPFCKGRTYSEIKQAIQGFIFNCNMSLICRGGQVLFSSIGLDLSIPEILKNRPAVAPEGVINGVYGDYQNEADMVFKAVCEVSNEKDGNGAYHRFPNILFNIRRGDLDEYEGNCKLLHELGANNPTIYYVNCMDLERTVMGCRTALPMNYFENYELDCLNTGNFMYNTINLPLIAIESENESVFYRKLDEIVELIYKSLHHRRKEVINAVYTKKMSNFLIQKDKDTGEPLWDIDRTTITIGYCGLNECLEILYDKNIIEAENEGLKIINFLNKKKEAFNKRDGLRWSVIGSPAESTAHRFAKIIKEKYPDVHVQGEGGNYYLTNSSHIPVSSEMNLVYHIKNASKFHKISQGGNILHLWLGEVWSDPVAIWKLNKKIIETGTLFWAYSKVFTFCNECGETINDKIEKCQKCGSTDLTTYDRITGYYLPTNGYNNGKKQEFEDRFRHKINI